MTFDTAIFYDVENLIKGYDSSQQIIKKVSLRSILSAIKESKRIGEIAVQRAYANWSHYELNTMRRDITELGIEPIQVFGFSQYPIAKDAADIHLAVDAIDLAYVRQSIRVFIIVSGDGGFATLAKKLHEYGRTVIGCGYPKSTSRVFLAVCDEFIWIPDPEQEIEDHSKLLSSPIQSTNPHVIRLLKQITPIASNDADDLLSKTKEVLDWFDKDPEMHKELMQGGIHLSVIQEAIKTTLPGFDPMLFFFPKLSMYLQFACQDTSLCVAKLPSGDKCLALRKLLANSEALPDLNKYEPQSIEAYWAILQAYGPYRPVPFDDLFEIAKWLADNPIIGAEYLVAVETAIKSLSPNVSDKSVKSAFKNFITSGIFEAKPKDVSPSEQRFTLREDLRSPYLILNTLQIAFHQKIEKFLPDVKNEIIEKILPCSPRLPESLANQS